MSAVNTGTLRGLAYVYRAEAVAASQPFGDYLVTKLAALAKQIERGRLTSVSNEAGAFSYSTSADSTQDRMFALVSEMKERWEAARSYLVAMGTAEPQEDATFAQMMTDLIPCRESYNDHSGLRCA